MEREVINFQAAAERRREKVSATIEDFRSSVDALAAELCERQEGFPFPGLEPDVLESLRATDKEFPGVATPIDELVLRFQEEGIKIVPAKGGGGKAFVLPFGSDDVESDSIYPRYLRVTEGMDEKLRELVDASKAIWKMDPRPR